ncbi:hypothetical protein ACW4V3_01290 [Faecalibacterium duncaniae]
MSKLFHNFWEFPAHGQAFTPVQESFSGETPTRFPAASKIWIFRFQIRLNLLYFRTSDATILAVHKMYYILERGGEKIMKKRWFVVILTIGLLLHVLPLSVLALSPDPTITDSDGTLLGWSDLSTVPYSLDDSQEQEPPVPDLSETGSEKSLADADRDEATDDLPAGNPTPPPPAS